jgi:hypothetical protein
LKTGIPSKKLQSVILYTEANKFSTSHLLGKIQPKCKKGKMKKQQNKSLLTNMHRVSNSLILDHRAIKKGQHNLGLKDSAENSNQEFTGEESLTHNLAQSAFQQLQEDTQYLNYDKNYYLQDFETKN